MAVIGSCWQLLAVGACLQTSKGERSGAEDLVKASSVQKDADNIPQSIFWLAFNKGRFVGPNLKQYLLPKPKILHSNNFKFTLDFC